MLKNYFLIALRNLSRQGIAIINIIGLVVGMACTILLIMYVENELSFDRFNKNSSSIYRIVSERKTPAGVKWDVTSPPPLAAALTNDFPKVTCVRFLNMDNPTPIISYGNSKFSEKNIYFTDPDIFNVFTIRFAEGNPAEALQNPNSVVITKETAKKYFGEDNPSGKILSLNNLLDLKITGVVENPPSNSSLKYDFLVSFSTLYGWVGKNYMNRWQNNMCHIYALLPANYSSSQIEKQLPGFIKKYFDETASLKQLRLQPLNRVHLYSNKDFNIASSGDINYVYLLSAVAVFILLVACFNFINLTIVQFTRRSKEIGVRKLIGASRGQLIKQFLGEEFLLTFVSILMAIAISLIAAPGFGRLIGSDLHVDLTENPGIILMPALFVLLAGFLAGAYPAFILSSFLPANSLKGNVQAGAKRKPFRKTLVVVQFTLTVILIIGTWTVYNQIDFMRNKKLGFDASQVIVVPIHNETLRKNPEALKNMLREQRGVLQVGAAALLPGGPIGKAHYSVPGTLDNGTISMLWVDADFIKTLGIPLAAGRNFSNEFKTDASEAFMLNEEAVKQLGWKDPAHAIGKSFELTGSKKGTVIGVVKNFHLTSFHSKIEPLVMHIWPFLNYALIKVDVNHLTTSLTAIKKVWKEFSPDDPFEFTFLNNNFEKFYQSDKQLGAVSAYFTLVALAIACFGLFSLASFTISQRTKEIGIRKVLGASVISILRTQLTEFIILVAISAVIASPIAYYFMNKWLQEFAYRIEISWLTFFLAGGIALIVALTTVLVQAIKAATANPVESLRDE